MCAPFGQTNFWRQPSSSFCWWKRNSCSVRESKYVIDVSGEPSPSADTRSEMWYATTSCGVFAPLVNSA